MSVFFAFAQDPVLPWSTVKVNQTSKSSSTLSTPSQVQTAAVPPTSIMYDRSDVYVHPSPNPQSEVHLSINPTNFNNLLLSCNTNQIGNSFTGYYYSNDAGNTWTGQDVLPNNAFGRGDPSTAFDASGNAYLETMASNNTADLPDGYFIQKSTNGGVTWLPQKRGAGPLSDGDKPMIAADNTLGTAFTNNFYCAWGHTGIQFNRSTDGGNTFSVPTTLLGGANQGANVQTGPNGEVYVAFAKYTNSSGGATSIQMHTSTDGGLAFNSPIYPALIFTGIRSTPEQNPLFNNIRVNDFPSMAVDKSQGSHRGRVYIAVAGKENGNGKAVIMLGYSDNKGTQWSTFKIISIPNATQSWFPWVAVDDLTGDVYVDYYAFDTSTQWQTNTYVAMSRDGGVNFTNQKVSDVPHITAGIPQFSQGYAGDYIGIVAHGGKAIAAWIDDRNGTWQVYTSQVGVNPVIKGIPAFCSSSTYTISDVPIGATVTWSATPSGIISLAPSGNQVVATKISQGFVTLKATLSGVYSDISPSFNISTIPSENSITSVMSGSCNSGYQTWQLTANPNMANPTGFLWTKASNATGDFIIYSPNSQSTYVAVKGGGGIDVTYVDACGETSGKDGVTIYSSCGFSSAAVTAFPNPTTNQLTIKNSPITSDALSAASTGIPDTVVYDRVYNDYKVFLYDSKGKVIKTAKNISGNDTITLDTSNIPNGTYYLHILEGAEKIEKQIIVQH